MASTQQIGGFERGGGFRTTHWPLVWDAKNCHGNGGADSLESLCRIYWPPIYAYLRRAGHSPADAEDLTQAFFLHLFEQNFLNHLRHREGKFRAFLLTFLKHFLSDVRSRSAAARRGGGKTILSLDRLQEEERRTAEPRSTTLTPDEAFERRWAETLMQRATARLREEYHEKGRGAIFEALKDLEPGERGTAGYAAIAERLGVTADSLKSATHRMRLRHRNILRREIAATLDNPTEIEAEIAYFLEVLGR